MRLGMSMEPEKQTDWVKEEERGRPVNRSNDQIGTKNPQRPMFTVMTGKPEQVSLFLLLCTFYLIILCISISSSIYCLFTLKNKKTMELSSQAIFYYTYLFCVHVHVSVFLHMCVYAHVCLCVCVYTCEI